MCDAFVMDSYAEFIPPVWIEVRHEDFDQQVSAQLAGPAKSGHSDYSWALF